MCRHLQGPGQAGARLPLQGPQGGLCPLAHPLSTVPRAPVQEQLAGCAHAGAAAGRELLGAARGRHGLSDHLLAAAAAGVVAGAQGAASVLRHAAQRLLGPQPAGGCARGIASIQGAWRCRLGFTGIQLVQHVQAHLPSLQGNHWLRAAKVGVVRELQGAGRGGAARRWAGRHRRRATPTHPKQLLR